MNSIQFLAYIAPFLLIFTLITISVIDGRLIKMLLYVGSLAITSGLLSLVTFSKDDKNKLPENYNELCKTFGWNFFKESYYKPSLSTYCIVFTMAYTIAPMIFVNNINVGYIIFLIFIFVLDFGINYGYNKCYTPRSYFISLVFGVLVGSVLSLLIHDRAKEFVYFGDKDERRCGKVSKNKFKCSVYKNGVLIRDLNN